MENWDVYFNEEYSRVSKNYNKAKHLGFNDKNDFAKWYLDELKAREFKCYYCETSIHDIKKLIVKGYLKTRAVRAGGVRGLVLEVDKNDDLYSKEHCVLSCYYCNNDKSYTTSKEDYKQFFGANRKVYFDFLLKKLKANR